MNPRRRNNQLPQIQRSRAFAYSLCATPVTTGEGASYTVRMRIDFPLSVECRFELRIALEEHAVRTRTKAQVGSDGAHMQCLHTGKIDTVVRNVIRVLELETRKYFANVAVTHQAMAEPGNFYVSRS